ncbi:MAG: VOC family protein [Pseudotabrizicola sp.]|uniref:VOC family protein n=1 Tax=Pseudotabrizicola sp. TaxID=2939647 RepID=UPI00272F62F4|nr:VOC family protein [Pseudotabrizicola sp.]MDP2080560.1 VOC family protein [Pseudotabrizicola sp.]MDZ7573288.1 VOC family protein [Pseudotabrizicola sp.]
MKLRLDHLAVSCTALDAGAAAVEAALGLPLVSGGRHAHMGTHNRLLRLGDLYLEVIAIDPDAAAPSWPRWFDLDRFSGAPRLTNWVAACDDLDAALLHAPDGAGGAMDLARGDLRWRMGVPDNGRLPFGGAFPALIQWQGPHPAPRLPDTGARLARLVVSHPEAVALRAALSGLTDARMVIEPGSLTLCAEIDTPHGRRVLA